MLFPNDTDDKCVKVSCSLFEQLPPEVIEKIMTCKVLSVRDVLNVSESCSYFKNIIHDNEYIWKEKFFQHYSFPYDINLEEMPTNYFDELRFASNPKQQMYTSLGSTINYPGSSILEKRLLREWIRLIQKEWRNYFIVVDGFGGVLRHDKRASMLSAIHAAPEQRCPHPTYLAEFSIKHNKEKIEQQIMNKTVNLNKPYNEKPKIYHLNFGDDSDDDDELSID